MNERIFAEVGFGNESFFSTEIERGKKEYRIAKFIVPKKMCGVYLRIWIFKNIFILSSYDGFKFMKKPKIKFKFLFGIEGVGK